MVCEGRRRRMEWENVWSSLRGVILIQPAWRHRDIKLRCLYALGAIRSKLQIVDSFLFLPNLQHSSVHTQKNVGETKCIICIRNNNNNNRFFFLCGASERYCLIGNTRTQTMSSKSRVVGRIKKKGVYIENGTGSMHTKMQRTTSRRQKLIWWIAAFRRRTSSAAGRTKGLSLFLSFFPLYSSSIFFFFFSVSFIIIFSSFLRI